LGATFGQDLSDSVGVFLDSLSQPCFVLASFLEGGFIVSEDIIKSSAFDTLVGQGGLNLVNGFLQDGFVSLPVVIEIFQILLCIGQQIVEDIGCLIDGVF